MYKTEVEYLFSARQAGAFKTRTYKAVGKNEVGLFVSYVGSYMICLCDIKQVYYIIALAVHCTNGKCCLDKLT